MLMLLSCRDDVMEGHNVLISGPAGTGTMNFAHVRRGCLAALQAGSDGQLRSLGACDAAWHEVIMCVPREEFSHQSHCQVRITDRDRGRQTL
jgi:hypothetical protein